MEKREVWFVTCEVYLGFYTLVVVGFRTLSLRGTLHTVSNYLNAPA